MSIRDPFLLVAGVVRKMTEANSEAEIEAAEAYESLFIPALFGEWAPRVADVAGLGAGERVLDVACGTGILAREAVRRVGDRGMVAGVDLSAGMLAVARRLAPKVEFREGAAESLPFQDHSFDAVVSQFGLMLFEDRERAVREMLRVLRSGGRFAVCVWNDLEHNAAYAAEVALLERTAGEAAADGLRAPFSLGDRDSLGTLFDDAGAHGAKVETRTGTARFPSARVMVEADLRGWLPSVGVVLPEDVIGEVLEEAEEAMAPYASPDGTVSFPTSAHIVTGKRAAA